MTFESGEIDGKRWFCGDIPVGKGEIVYIDTRTGKGVSDVCDLLYKFISFQSNKVSLPFSTKEDISQDLYVLALEALPKYDITKKANILTFLQGHVQKRLINKYKFASEKKRRATYYNISEYKVRCPSCRKFTIASSKKPTVSCDHCGQKGKFKEWKRYNLPVLSLPFSYVETSIAELANNASDCGGLEEILSDEHNFLYFLGGSRYGLEEEAQKKIDFLRIFERLDKTNKEIVTMVLEGHVYKDIASQVGLSEKATYARVAKIISSQKMN